MHKSQISSRARIAERAALAGRSGGGATPSTVGTNVARRTQTPVAHCAAPVRNRNAAKMTGAQRNSEGRRSEWSASPYFFTDAKWSQTVRSQNV